MCVSQRVTYKIYCVYYREKCCVFVQADTCTLSEDEDDMVADSGEGLSVSATPQFKSSSGFTPTPGGPFSALTPSMWPQDILSRLNNPVCDFE